MASDWNKPDGQFVVRPQDVDAFVAALPVKKIFGVGKVTAARLARLGAHTCADLRAWSVAELTREFGSFGASLHRLCRGIDERPVQPDRVRKSLSVETTYTPDLHDLAACRAGLLALLEDWLDKLESEGGIGFMEKPAVRVAASKIFRLQVMGGEDPIAAPLLLDIDAWLDTHAPGASLKAFLDQAKADLTSVHSSIRPADFTAQFLLRALKKCVAPT